MRQMLVAPEALAGVASVAGSPLEERSCRGQTGRPVLAA